MTYGKIFQHRTSQKDQYGHILSQGMQIPGPSGYGPVSPIRHLEATGLSLCEGGRVCRPNDSGAGSKNCLHGQTLPKSGSSDTAICQFQRTNLKRSGHPGLGGFSLQGSEACLSPGKGFEKLSWNTALTDCQRKKSGRHTRFSSLTKPGMQALRKL